MNKKNSIRITEYGLIFLVVFSPIPFASVLNWSVLVIQLTVLGMAVSYVLTAREHMLADSFQKTAKKARIFFLLFSGYLLLQVVPLPQALVRILSPAQHSLHQTIAADSAAKKFLTLSLIPYDTIQKALLFLCYFLLGFLIFKTIKKKGQIYRILSVIVIMGTVEAFYGLFEFSRKAPQILFYPKTFNADSVTGTFVNRNHFAGYLEMIIPLAVGLALAKIEFFSPRKNGFREKLFYLVQKDALKNMIFTGAVIVMSMAIIFSKSRTGIFVLGFSFFLMFLLTLYDRNKLRMRTAWSRNFLKVTFSIIIILSILFGVNQILMRFSPEYIKHEGRFAYWGNVSSQIQDYLFFGTGLGTFARIYPLYEEEEGYGTLTHVHNDYLEFLAELGIVGFSLLFVFVGFLFYWMVKTWADRTHPEVKGLGLGGIAALSTLLFHALTDFNFHIPANALLFTVIFSLTLACVFYKKR